MSDPVVLALGVEEEFQLVDARTGSLVSGFKRLMERATPAIHTHMKPEFLQCVVECVTGICPSVAEVRSHTTALRATAAALAREHGMALVSAGTHPQGRWEEQARTPGKRYQELDHQLQDVARSILIYGLHVHVNIPDPELRVQVMNQARNFLPHILAFSANSPFWRGRKTGFQAYRPAVWAPFPMAGIPEPFEDYAAYLRFCDLFRRVNSLGETRRVWWDLRLHHHFPTLEFRIADMPLSHDDTIAIVAFIQGLCRVLIARAQAGNPFPAQPAAYIHENRWRAAIGGVHGMMVDFESERELPAEVVLGQALDLVEGAMLELGAERELRHLRHMLLPRGICGAERQLAAYRRGGMAAVLRMLMRETMAGIDPECAMPLKANRVPAAVVRPRIRVRQSA